MPSNEPLIFVLFGATGDLAKRMVLPAFYELFTRGLMPDRWHLVGNGRGDVAHEDFRAHVRGVLDEFGPKEVDEQQWTDFADRLRFAGGGFEKSDPGSLLDVLHESRTEVGSDARYVHYLAIPPVAFETVTKGLAEHDLLGDARVVFEKPYGTSLDSFHELDTLVHSVMDEEQVYRIDHFLGKEATQNLHVLRFGNEMIGRSWCRDAVAQVQVDVPETLDVADRAAFYDATGAFRDMIVTHLFQVAAEVAMDPPVSMKAEDLQDSRESVMAAFRPLKAEDVVFGQYAGYDDLPEVKKGSTTDTFAAARLWVDTDRWRGVPFVLRSGKRLGVSRQVVTLLMRPTDGPLTHVPPYSSMVQLSLSGSGAINLPLVIKEPGAELDLVATRTELDLGKVAEGSALPPYVSLLHDVTVGDRSLFTSSAGLESAWAAVAAVVDSTAKPVTYEPGSSGPAAARTLTDDVGWLSETIPD